MVLTIVLFATVLAAYFLTSWIYRLYFSPIAGFPGPKLAALTFWYEGYWDIIRQGRYTWKIQELHRQYGPIVRINPVELHIQDPLFYDQIYVGPTRSTDKWSWSARMFGTSQAAVGTLHHGLHKIRRGALNPFFSKSSVVRMEPIMEQSADLLLQRLKQAGADGQVVNLSDAFTALSADVISSFCFGDSYHFLYEKDFNPGWRKLMKDLSQATHVMKQFGWAYAIFFPFIPDIFIAALHPLTRKLVDLQRNIRNKVSQEWADFFEPHKQKRNENPRRSVFEEILQYSNLPVSELQVSRLTEEGFTLIGAGTMTTAHTLETITFSLLANPDILPRLRTELAEHYDEIKQAESKWTALTQLPYLSAVISEGLRLSFGVAHRLPRISPDSPIQYKEWTIPAGTPVSMTNMFIHLDPSIFPDPTSFRPERWLDRFPPLSSSVGEDQQIEPGVARKFLIPFSRGTRSCVAMNLAYAELYHAVHTLFKPVEHGGLEMQLYKTGKEDMEIAHDFFSPHAKKSSKGLRVLIHLNQSDRI